VLDSPPWSKWERLEACRAESTQDEQPVLGGTPIWHPVTRPVVVTLGWRDWIALVFHLERNRGNGLLEWGSSLRPLPSDSASVDGRLSTREQMEGS